MKKEKIIQLLIFLLVSLGLIYLYYNAGYDSFENTKKEVETEIAHIFSDFEKITKSKNLNIKSISLKEFQQINEKLPFDLYVYKNNQLVFWNNNRAIPELSVDLLEEEAKLVSLKNGYYIALKKTVGENTFIGMSVLRNSYSLVNKYLTNSFSKQFNFHDKDVILPATHSSGVPIFAPNGEVIFKILKEKRRSKVLDNTRNVLSVVVFILILIYYLNLTKYLQNYFSSELGLFFSFFIMLGILWLLNYIPFEFRKSVFFKTELYGSYFSSLGDLFITLLYFFTFSFQLMINFLKEKIIINVYTKLAFIIQLFFAFIFTNVILRSLVLDSVLNYGAKNLAMLNIYSLTGLFVALLLSSIYVFFIVIVFNNLKFNLKSFILLTLSAIFLLFVIRKLDFNYLSFILIAYYFIFSLFILLYKRFEKYKNVSMVIVVSIIFMVVNTSTVFIYYSDIKLQNNRKAVAFQKSRQKDILAEELFIKVRKQILEDDFIKNFFENPMFSYKNLYKRLISKYFGEYFSKFDITIVPFNYEGKPIKNLSDVSLEDYYNQVNKFGYETLAKDLSFIDKKQAVFSYISILQIVKNHKFVGTLAIKISPKSYNIGNVYPELLLHGKNKLISQYEEVFHYATYIDGVIFQNNENLVYPTTIEALKNDKKTLYDHFIIDINDYKKIVVSTLKIRFIDKISVFSFILSFYLIIGLILVISFFLFNKKNYKEYFIFTFRKKITIAMLSLVLISFIGLGVATISYFSRQYNSYHKKRLIRKEKSISRSIDFIINKNNIKTENDLKKHFLSTSNSDIIELSDIHKMDINFYDLNGLLFSSSQDGIFTTGLLSSVINPKSFVLLHNLKAEQFVQDEHIGNLNYLAIYVPIYNKLGEVISYLNIPYFSKEKNLKQDISNFMISLINVYILLFIIASVIAFFVSNSITNPLKEISDKLKNISLSKKNKNIKWDTNDEIGALVYEYNKMIVELEHSANLLAKTERDEAWREMAKQIAHEIKNPLTPMKLSIQYLQRALKDDPVRANELAKKMSITMIEQIENLTNIATAFSSFAKMPRANKEDVYLEHVLDTAIDLFSRDKLKIIKNYTVLNAKVFADKNQLISVFNNLLKNAIQATEETLDAKIIVSLEKEKEFFRICVLDNGVGISEEKYKKVFVPNFTTKSSGSGLGLAISKQIIENLKGRIWFESKLNKYTKFYIEIPKK